MAGPFMFRFLLARPYSTNTIPLLIRLRFDLDLLSPFPSEVDEPSLLALTEE